MALTASTMLELGTPAPDFALPDTDGRVVRRDDYAGRPLLVMFICNHCPYVKHVAPELALLGKQLQDRGVGVVAIMSNDVEQYPADSPEQMKAEKLRQGYTFPYLYDASQAVAAAYTAACTPDFFLFDRQHRLAYRGQLDDTRPSRLGPGQYTSDNAPHGADLRAAVDAVLADVPVPGTQKPSMGCNIKWKPGNAPPYAA